jgi:hypothetical protein
MRPWASIGIETLLIDFECCPIDESGMMFANEYAPFLHRKMTRALLDCALFIDVAFAAALAVGVSASIHRIGQNVMDRGVGWNHPKNLPLRTILQRKGRSFRAQPQPDAARGAKLGETFEDRADRGHDRFIGME